MALMIETQHIRITRLFMIKLKLRMTVREGGKDLGVSLRRPRQLEDDALGRHRSKMERFRRKLSALLGGSFHDLAVVVTGRAIESATIFIGPGP